MKPQLQPRSIPVFRHATAFCASPASSTSFLSLREPFPDRSSHKHRMPSLIQTTPSHYNTYLPPSSSQPSANQIP